MSNELFYLNAYNECFRGGEFSQVMQIAKKDYKDAGRSVSKAICHGLQVAKVISNTK